MKTSVWAVVALSLASTLGHAAEFKAESADFAAGVVAPAQFANSFGCTGGNVSPAVTWSGAPAGTKSFFVTLYDKDAPTGSGWWHWIVADIPANETGLKAGAADAAVGLPAGAFMIRNDAGVAGFLGACPPPGETHDYTITVKALGIDKLPVPPDASGAMAGFVSNMNVLATATIAAKGRRDRSGRRRKGREPWICNSG